MNEAEKQVVEEDKKAFWMVQATGLLRCGRIFQLAEASTAEQAVALYAKCFELPAGTSIDVQLVAPPSDDREDGAK